MRKCTASLDNFEYVTDTELINIFLGMSKTTCGSDPFPTRLLMSYVLAIIPTTNCKYMLENRGFCDF